MTWQIWLSSWMTIWVLRAMRAEKSVGRPMASSKELVCSDWVPPSTADSASSVVLMTLLVRILLGQAPARGLAVGAEHR